jgi:hypothetical protein
VLVVMVKLLVDGKIPKAWAVAILAFVALAFPVLQANRVFRDQQFLSPSEVAANISKVFEETLTLSKEVTKGADRSQTVFERMTLKGVVEMIVTQTGQTVPFQNGHTLTPLLATFIPRLIWPDKPDVPTGQVVNKEFKLSDVEYTYISPSHLGELYWNFGWSGVIAGMSIIGFLLGYLGRRFDLSQYANLTRVMVVVATIRMLVLGSEGVINTQYSMWMRTMVAIWLLHIALAKPSDSRPVKASFGSNSNVAPPRTERIFHNLLR